MVNQQMDGEVTTYRYRVGFLLADNNKVAYTCDGETFQPEAGELATIKAQMVTTVDFP